MEILCMSSLQSSGAWKFVIDVAVIPIQDEAEKDYVFRERLEHFHTRATSEEYYPLFMLIPHSTNFSKCTYYESMLGQNYSAIWRGRSLACSEIRTHGFSSWAVNTKVSRSLTSVWNTELLWIAVMLPTLLSKTPYKFSISLWSLMPILSTSQQIRGSNWDRFRTIFDL